jgi:anti-sigma B factor antagonist
MRATPQQQPHPPSHIRAGSRIPRVNPPLRYACRHTGEPSPVILEADFEPVDLTTAVFRLTGHMSHGTRLHEVESKISEVANQGIHKLILDLSGVEFLDSAGLGVLILLNANMKVRGGQLRLVAPAAKVLEVIKMTHTDSILKIDRNLEAALAS